MMEKLNKEKEFDNFQFWLMEMDDVLEDFMDKLPQNLRLDFSADSLLRLEEWILRHYSTVESLQKNKQMLDFLSRYVGETFRKRLGGKWEIELDHPEYVFYGLPQIKFEKVSPDCPLSVVLAAVDRKKGDYMLKILKNKEKRSSET
ncbi:hypothetical protein [Paludifilum halophilum]|uniref:Uncharacterized protein n=1 Tax=Paludifilum halophilum TaxID=1642702 RepID=A0A235B4R5_9BACL|nr:hypothetical protein [Paludifilum halophilum]OYD07273.1 hypothetical protein CHM34_12905 [Paludifilum halophilum]